MSNGDHTERLPQEGKCRNESESGISARASAVAQGVLEEIEALAGTTACRSTLVACYQRDARNLSNWQGSNLFFIDTIIFKSDAGGLEKYNSLSPRASKP